jgi:hypothetical protein
MKPIRAILGLAVLLSGVAPGQSMSTNQHEQLSFGTGHPRPVVKHPVSLSDAELAALRQATVREVGAMVGFASSEDAGSPPIPKLTRQGLEAAVIHLNGPAERDLVVIGSGRQYARPIIIVDAEGRHTSADLAPFTPFPFWVIHEEHGKPKVVLAIFTDRMDILPYKDHGFANIAVSGNMPGLTVFFQFDGDKYIYAGANSN